MKLTKCDPTVVLATTWRTYIYTKTPLHSGYYNIQCLKNVENQLRFHKVAESLKVGTFLRHSVHRHRLWWEWESSCATMVHSESRDHWSLDCWHLCNVVYTHRQYQTAPLTTMSNSVIYKFSSPTPDHHDHDLVSCHVHNQSHHHSNHCKHINLLWMDDWTYFPQRSSLINILNVKVTE